MARYDQAKTGKIITDPKNMTTALSRPFEVRHILCHGFPHGQVYKREEIDVFLVATDRFAAAQREFEEKRPSARDMSSGRHSRRTVPMAPAAEQHRSYFGSRKRIS